MRCLSLACLELALVVVCAAAQDAESVALLKNKDPDQRVEGAKRLIKAGDKKSVKAVFEALVAERDGYAGREMGRTFSGLTEIEGLDTAHREILGFRKPEEMFAAFWAMAGLAEGGSPTGDSIIKEALEKDHKKNVSLRVCAFEAIGAAKRTELAQCVLDAVNTYKADDDKGNIFETLAAITAARRLCPDKDREAQKPYLEALIHILDASRDDRIKYFAALGLSRITGQPAYLSAGWWRMWLEQGKGGEHKSGKTVAFFDTIAVGTRVIFAIDVSGSMEWPADMEFAKNPVTGKGKKDGPDYSQVKTKLDLAKIELLWTLQHLPEDYYFNVVIYSTEHKLLIEDEPDLVQATEENKRKFSIALYGLKPKGGTNIHGALKQCFGVVRKGKVKDDPALDAKAMLEGVDTIFFLTDGSPSWSDDSTGTGRVDAKWGAIGNGRYVEPQAILADISRINTFRKVVIHTIAIGKDADADLMKELAKQNHGRFVNRG
jgi:hypothetical protein